ncbi:NADPH-dependent FMN reductase [Frankia sp. CcI156]|jgi:NAD(P)H-dependent FMN reductase|uniref:NADPH-dependent FMN reductase n=1 Tax=Frankia casuarinae (strain DSM 45818 / CECT 9043 / HFP020203 / CcI3) TaxID=106370 RepID=Q2JBS9_FRACC|nr:MULTISPECIES: NAD(P)H-dependent oxidoreductase [Frankia]ABD11263.1 NADPH-dependent FMN reductase [Frankia casuarinae]ETA03160.1 putative flavoprotein [Frankia sp. CcI6]EYT90324.1 putative flavoprotein [Frankia casuarinae]KDA41151.1 putative flavoprotein [Frankia sp. BMG5.23]OAA19844.1 putative flavoprotein [Frankia casuarinae]
MLDQPTNLAVVIGSNRVGRFAPVVAQWFIKQVSAHDSIVTSVVDLDDVRLPERLGTSSGPEVAELADVTRQLAAADAFVVITPEYNHSYPAVLKNVIDWHYTEWQAKPVGFVSYGGQAGGLRAVEHLRQVFAELHAVTIRDTVSFHGAWDRFHADGTPKDPEGCNTAAQTLIRQLEWWAVALAEAREKRPYTV